MKIPYCTGCGEYPGDFVADEIETLRVRIVELEQSLRMKSVVAIGLQNRADELTRRAEKAEAALTEARARLVAADRMAEALGWFLFRHSNPMSGTKELDEYLSLKETGQ